jgi:hypothetical protein
MHEVSLAGNRQVGIPKKFRPFLYALNLIYTSLARTSNTDRYSTSAPKAKSS